MKVAVFSTKPYDEQFLAQANQASHQHELVFLEPRLNAATAALAKGFDAVCVFVNDQVDANVLEQLAAGVRDLPILQGWRREVFGSDALDLVEGKLAFAVENGKLKMTHIDELEV